MRKMHFWADQPLLNSHSLVFPVKTLGSGWEAARHSCTGVSDLSKGKSIWQMANAKVFRQTDISGLFNSIVIASSQNESR